MLQRSYLYLLPPISALLLLVFRIIRIVTEPLSKLPGPFWARFTRLWYLKQLRKGDFEKCNVELHKRYGNIVRIAPNWYSIDDPEALRLIYGPGSQFPKADWYYGLANPDTSRPTLLTDRDSARHAVRRRKFSAAYTMSAVIIYEAFVDNCIALLLRRFNELAEGGIEADLGRWLQCYAFDVIGEITFAKRFGFLDAGLDIGSIMQSIWKKVSYGAQIGIYHELHPYAFKAITWLKGPQALGEDYNLEFTRAAISEGKARFAQEKENTTTRPPDFLTKFLEAPTANPENFTDYDVFMGCMTNIVAGSDTTGIALSAILYNLLKNPRTFKALRKEVDDMLASGDITIPITFQSSQKMPYLQAVIKEAIRIHPPNALPLWRKILPGGATIGGRFFPEGVVVGTNPSVAHRNTTVYGEDAEQFRPERWIEGTKEQLSMMDRSFIPFGMGSRTCIGKNITMLEISKLVPQLIREFDFELVRKEGGWETVNNWFLKPLGFRCWIRRRVV